MPDSATPPVPPVSPASAEAKPSRWGRRADAMAVGLVLAFAFLAGSFVARNSDVWLHLATGRLLAAGEYHFGTDPFAYTTAGVYWANHSWLFDLSLYLAFGWFGGSGLVVLKALAVALTAGLMLAAARGRGPVWVAAVCVMLAVLAMSPRLLLQPSVASLLLLAGCLCCLRTGGRALAAVPVLIGVWVNVDAWFVLGPLLVGLIWLSRRIDPDRGSLPPWPAWLVPASLAATLLSPHHVFALRPPLELSSAVWTSEFAADPRFSWLFASPWDGRPLGAAGGYNLAAWAFFVLLGLGLVSFAVNRRAWFGWRSMVWLAFAALGVWQARLVPFFAVVAGPITALNLGEVLPATRFVRPGRGVALVAGVVLVAVAWFGWTNGFHARDRGAGWAVQADLTGVRAAEVVAAWRQSGKLPPAGRVFASHPDAGHYLAWFAPGERSFLDSRLQLFTGVAGEYAALSRAVGVLPGDDTRPAGEPLRPPDFAAVLLYEPDPLRFTRGLQASTAGRNGLAVAEVAGGAALLTTAGGFDPERGAFGGAADLPVPGTELAALAEPEPWWVPRRHHGRRGSWPADQAATYLRLFNAGPSKSPALPLLAVRAGRAGAEADAADPVAWGSVGLAYLTLGARTWEGEAAAGLAALDRLRFIQITTALVQEALLNPRSVAAHETLARVFRDRHILDLAFGHAERMRQLAREAGRLPRETAEAFADRIAQLDRFVELLEATVQDAENRFVIRTAGMSGDPLGRARVAAELGLTQKAIDVLQFSHPDLYGAAGLRTLADLLLQTGQAAGCRALLDREELRRNPDVLGYYTLPRPGPAGSPAGFDSLPARDWFDLCQCAAAGRYPAAVAAVDRLCALLEDQERQLAPPLGKMLSAAAGSGVGLWVPTNPLLARLMILPDQAGLSESYRRTRLLAAARADLTTLAGVLELERGDAEAAGGRFAAALGLYAGAKELGHPLPGQPLAARYHEAIRAKH